MAGSPKLRFLLEFAIWPRLCRGHSHRPQPPTLRVMISMTRAPPARRGAGRDASHPNARASHPGASPCPHHRNTSPHTPGFTIQCDDVLIFRMHAKSGAERVTQRVVRLHARKESFARCMHAKSRLSAKSRAAACVQRVVCPLHACKESFARCCMHAKSRLPAACAAAPQAAGPRRACNMQYACGIGYTAAYVYRILSRLYSCTDGCYYESRRLYSVGCITPAVARGIF
eukprot:COSAG01_NODE_6671_length_3553_cov_23.353214_3_plen_229_part_00